MREVEFHVPRLCDLKRAEALIERVAADHGLTVGMKGTLASYPDSIHWHFKRSTERGTLEITLYPKERRIWAQVQDGRRAEWIDKELALLRRMIERELRLHSSRT